MLAVSREHLSLLIAGTALPGLGDSGNILKGTLWSASRFVELGVYRVAHLLWERDMLSPNLKLRLVVNLSCDPGQ